MGAAVWFPVASVWNALVVLVSGMPSPDLETGPETPRQRWPYDNEARQSQTMHIQWSDEPDHAWICRAACLPVTAEAWTAVG